MKGSAATMSMTVTSRLAAPATAGADAGNPPTVPPPAPAAPRSVPQALLRGAMGCCPACGARGMFPRYLKVTPACTTCGEELYHHRADDAPPYATIMVVGHVVVPLMVLVEELYAPPLGVHMALWLPLTLILCLALLPPLKGMLVNLQWALRMHGFDPASDEYEPRPPESAALPAAARP